MTLVNKKMTGVLEKWHKNTLQSNYTLHNSVQWVQSGDKYFTLLENLIDSSQNEIHLQTYIFAPDTTGNRISEALIRAAKRRVKVFLLLDAYGSNDLKNDWYERMNQAGIQTRKFGRLFSGGRFHLGRRQHHKITVIDGNVSLVGGINISDHYNSIEGSIPWLDFAVVMQGDVSRRLQLFCRQRWYNLKYSFGNSRKNLQAEFNPSANPGNSAIRIRRNDFTRNKIDITISYRQALRYSEKSIILVGGYFLPGGRTRRLMRKAVKRGVQISIVVSEKSDVKVLVNARRYLYDWLLRNGIHVYEYLPSNVHGKVLISDDRWTSIGSYDLNNLSTYSNIELNVDINNNAFSSSLSSHIRELMAENCRKIDPEKRYGQVTVFSRILMWISYRFVKTLFVLSVILAGTEDGEN